MSRPPTRNIPLAPATLDWQGNVPLSRQYGDIYFSSRDGLAESRHVFLHHNELPQRWRDAALRHFVIAETGFGTGLNFLAAVEAWLANAGGEAHLHYVSVEKHPLSPRDLALALGARPELSSLVPELLRQYPPPVRGVHRLQLYGGRVSLSLYLMDIAEALEELDIRADAWFLDGFAPAKNPDMWDAQVLTRVGALTAAGGSFATFTAAGPVRRSLQAAGFEVNKAEGFAGKREMLHGRMGRADNAAPAVSALFKPWFGYSALPEPRPRTALVVGAGLAGAFTARALARRGWRVTVLEQAAAPARGASGNAAAVIYGKFSTHDAVDYRFYQQAYLHALRCYAALGLGDAWSACGVLQLAVAEADRLRQAELAAAWPAQVMRLLSAVEAGVLAGVQLDRGGLFFPDAGWVDPARVCAHLLNHPAIELKTGCAVAALNYQIADGRAGEWRLYDQAGHVLGAAPAVILANAAGAAGFAQTDYLPLSRVRGQVSYVTATAASAALNCVLSFDGYITPALQGCHSLGATFDRGNDEMELAVADHLRNLENLEQAAPALRRALAVADAAALPGRVSFRTYAGALPVVGPAPEAAFYLKEYAGLAKGQLRKAYPKAACHPGLYLNLAHGARGVTTTPLAAEMIAAYIEGEPQPVPESLRQALHPGRFLIRQLKKNKLQITDDYRDVSGGIEPGTAIGSTEDTLKIRG
ncbi:MAG TPA: bifunctional tRNA (5-methylaminomethyl-2-thiouridine)(34)-methyltransferase MnmD/FAD-dependent 5-carboxymethylaminomethyl-2-thiouridine(34) oxidoreductase MnmC [Gammaproteobacteria bacterium]|nr:bifunctional tRNA (5-methylaminomethyl-2-thiouridine)(34)-methyltransferase MnmD/FAD-dependent 5-carboxymethylaminomethyl-2-thiouridine(34) oxidoreductase MnmC [Gammaproteobacteria bacterium]